MLVGAILPQKTISSQELEFTQRRANVFKHGMTASFFISFPLLSVVLPAASNAFERHPDRVSPSGVRRTDKEIGYFIFGLSFPIDCDLRQ